MPNYLYQNNKIGEPDFFIINHKSQRDIIHGELICKINRKQDILVAAFKMYCLTHDYGCMKYYIKKWFPDSGIKLPTERYFKCKQRKWTRTLVFGSPRPIFCTDLNRCCVYYYLEEVDDKYITECERCEYNFLDNVYDLYPAQVLFEVVT